MYPRTTIESRRPLFSRRGPGVGAVVKGCREVARVAVAEAVVAVGVTSLDDTVQPERNLLRLALLLMALHSSLTGIGLLAQPDFLLRWGGWGEVQQTFFPAQGGVFHILMAVLYVMASRLGAARETLIRLTILVKSVAALFLIVYYAGVEAIWLVGASGVGDALMAVAVFVLWMKEKQHHGG
ncbi:MAG: hypothetical protein M5R41_06555 [Bacteroidia bacterium]|nr:hypothetical protein [Bacteroidia bacterium]